MRPVWNFLSHKSVISNISRKSLQQFLKEPICKQASKQASLIGSLDFSTVGTVDVNELEAGAYNTVNAI